MPAKRPADTVKDKSAAPATRRARTEAQPEDCPFITVADLFSKGSKTLSKKKWKSIRAQIMSRSHKAKDKWWIQGKMVEENAEEVGKVDNFNVTTSRDPNTPPATAPEESDRVKWVRVTKDAQGKESLKVVVLLRLAENAKAFKCGAPETWSFVSESSSFGQALAKADYDVLIVGAGCSGVGTALMLTDMFGMEKERVVMIERGAEVGTSFRMWPKEMKFISPSFNQQGWTNSFDLNAVVRDTSPAYSLHAEHPTGVEYAEYLSALAKTRELNIRTKTEVVVVRPIGHPGLPLFEVDVKPVDGGEVKTITTRFVVWAAGEFQNARMPTPSAASAGAVAKGERFEGTEHCIHNSEIKSFAELPGDEYIVIGGYESGVDATVHLARAGKKCKMLASTPCWNVKTDDPSSELAPFTAARLRKIVAKSFPTPPQLYAPLRVIRVEKAADGAGYEVHAEWKAEDDEVPHAPLRPVVGHKAPPTEEAGREGTTVVFRTPNPPIMGTGFFGSVASQASYLFDFATGEPGEENAMESEFDDSETDNDDEESDNDSFDDDEEEEEEDEESDGDAEASGANGPPKKKKKEGCLRGFPKLTMDDESTKVPGVFLVGPTVSHGQSTFCFVYKFRQRFAVVANAICYSLGMETSRAVAYCRKHNMYLHSLKCCDDTCGEVC